MDFIYFNIYFNIIKYIIIKITININIFLKANISGKNILNKLNLFALFFHILFVSNFEYLCNNK
jgi:hypothetical protein